MLKKIFKLTHTRLIALGFAGIILCGTLLLLLPVCQTGAVEIGFSDALFTAVSATCVTGLVVCDTFTAWSVMGQAVILVMIQIGGLGFMTIATQLYMLLNKRVSLLGRQVLSESINTTSVGGVFQLTGRIVLFTALFEGIGALLLAIRFVPQFGLMRGLWFSLFHSVSAFCNAGFDLMGIRQPYSSLTAYYGDPLVVLTLSALIVLGGLGFIVWEDIRRHKTNWKRYTLHSKIVLSTTAVLLVGGTLLFILVEWNATSAGMNVMERLLTGLFNAVTPRTAGMNTVDTAALSAPGTLLTIVLMFIGGSPGSTAGGIKTTTIFVLLVCVLCDAKADKTPTAFGRRLGEGALRRASTVFFCNLLLALFAAFFIGALQPELPFGEVIFEVFSGIGTVGMSTGVTRSLNTLSRILVMVLMYCGRLGSMSFAMAIAERRKTAPVRLPEEQITIG